LAFGVLLPASASPRIYSIRAEKLLFIQGDPKLDFAAIVEVLDLSRASASTTSASLRHLSRQLIARTNRGQPLPSHRDMRQSPLAVAA
jgi:hypothetical protein